MPCAAAGRHSPRNRRRQQRFHASLHLVLKDIRKWHIDTLLFSPRSA
jgi:hypothetical protein